MIPVKEILEKQWFEFCQYIKNYAIKDSNTNDEEYNMGRYEIIKSPKIDLLDPSVEYYCMCNNLKINDILCEIDTIFT